jgi:pimeloyl-ACP methyl ester carboxylesterase
VAAAAICACNVSAQVGPAPQAPAPGRSALANAETFVVFLAGRNVGREEVALVRQADGWVLRGSSSLGPPIVTQVRQLEVRYDANWRPQSLELDGSVQGRDVKLTTTFADGKATNQLTEGEASTEKIDEVSADAVVVPNVFFGAYSVLAARLQGAAVGTEIKAYVAPQAEIPVRVEAVADERIETPRRTFSARRYSLTLQNPGAPVGASLWTEESGAFVRLSVPTQSLEVVREDVASAAARMSAFSIDGDESVRVPANGFSLAATVTTPKSPTGLAPAVVLIGGSGPADRDGTVAGIPVIGYIAKDLAAAGFLVVRYDKRGVGQSGGRPETATIVDYAEDARAIVNYLRKQRRKDVDGRRVAVLGYSEGAWVAMRLAATEKNVSALVLVAGASDTGGALVLEQQQHLLNTMQVSDEEKKAKADLQSRINAAATGQGTWDGIPDDLKAQADTPWFASFLAFDPAKVMKDVRQPLLIVQGARDRQVPARHADRLAELARARKRQVPVEVAHVEGVNHLLVPAVSGEISEYSGLSSQQVSAEATGTVARWLQSTLAAAK